MSPIFTLSALLFAAASSATVPAGWEKIFEATGGRDVWISDFEATGRGDWFVSGSWGVVRGSQAGGVDRYETHGRAVLDLFVETPDSVFAFGADELVLHFDGKKWAEEHIGPKPKRPGRGSDLVHSGFFQDESILAFGPWLLLVRQPNHTWELPAEPERERLLALGKLGPKMKLPAKCDEASWRWLGRNRGFFDCHDGQSFMYDAGTVTLKGTLPRECRTSMDGLAFSQGELFMSCGAAGKIWKTDGKGWRPFATLKGQKDISSVSVSDGCIFVASRRTVWRTCPQ